MFAAVFYLMGFANLGLQTVAARDAVSLGRTGRKMEEKGFQSYKTMRDEGLVQKRVMRW